MKRSILMAATVLPILAASAIAQETRTATATLANANGAAVGTVTVRSAPNGVVIVAALTGIPAGTYAFHVHETGACDAPTFETAGGHFNPTGAEHGFDNEAGPHAGDLPNIHVPENGELTVEIFSTMLWLADGEEGNLLDPDGAAIVIHAMHDDHMTDPTGNAGDRMICGVLAEGAVG